MNNQEIISKAITEIIGEFTDLADGDKQCFNPENTDAYAELASKGLNEHYEVQDLLNTLDDIIDGYTTLCDKYGDKFPY